MLSSIVGASNNYALKQDQCRLLQLPKDIRDLIYEEIVGREKVYIIFHPTWNKLTAVQERNIPGDQDSGNQKVKLGMGILSALRTCKML